MNIDKKTLDELDELHAAATPGPWRVETVPTSIGCCHTIRGGWPTRTWINEEREAYACIYDDGRYAHHRGGKLHANAVAIVAEHNALPHLTARVRELEAQLAAASEDSARMDWLESKRPSCWPLGAVRVYSGGLIMNAVASVDEDYGFVCDTFRAAIDAARGVDKSVEVPE